MPPIERRIVAVFAVLTVVSIGVGSYIAAASRSPSGNVRAAQASDDARQASDDGRYGPPPTASPPCSSPSLQFITSANTPSGTQTAAVAKEIGRFLVSYPPRINCQTTDDAIVRTMKFSFSWGQLSPGARSRARIRAITVQTADGVALGRSQTTVRAAAVRVSNSATVIFNPHLVLVPGQTRELKLIADTSEVTGGGVGGALSVALERAAIDLPYPTTLSTLVY